MRKGRFSTKRALQEPMPEHFRTLYGKPIIDYLITVNFPLVAPGRPIYTNSSQTPTTVVFR